MADATASEAEAPATEEPIGAAEGASQSAEPPTAAVGGARAADDDFKDAVSDDWKKMMAAHAQKQDAARFSAEAEDDALHAHR